MKSVIPYFKVVSSMVLGCLGQRGFKQPAVKNRPNANTRNQKAFCPLPSAFWLLVLITPSAVRAQIVPDNTLPVNSQVTGCPVCTIEGGTIRGVNLFHSFQEFGVQTGGEAFFNNGLDIENILGRVTGTNISDIDGWIRANGTANLFLINPNGIVFGENARLDVGGSFVASTANALGFGNQGVFSATEPEAPPLLTVNPDVLFFNQLAAQGVSSIEVRGSLSVLSGESLLLVGGNVAPDATKTGELLIDGGTLTAPGGRVELAGVGAPGEVGLVVNQGSLGLNFPADLARTDISIFGSTIDVREAGGGDIVIYAKDLTIGSSIIGNKPALGETYTLQVSIESPAVGSPNPNQEVEPNNSINRAQSLDDSFSVAANPDVESSTTVPFVSISGTGDGTFDYYSFTVETAGSQGIFDIDQGNTGGAGSLDTELFLFNAQGGLLASNDDAAITQGAGGSSSIRDSYISFTFETPGTYVIGVGKYNSNSRFSRLRAGITSGLGSVDAQAGDITIDATGTVAVAEGVISNNVQAGAIGRGGDVKITGSSISLTNGAVISASTLGEGDAGKVVIRATDSIFLDGEDSQGFVSGVFSEVQSGAQGNSGGVEIESGSLALTNGALISANTRGEGNAGQVVIRATDSVFLDGENTQGFTSRILSAVEPEAEGNSGGVEIESGSLTATNGAGINASTLGEGDAGQVVIRATDSVFLDGESRRGFNSGVFSLVESGARGNSGGVEIESGSLSLTNGAVISANTQGEGKAGLVVIRATDNVFLDGENTQGLSSRILSAVQSGAKGNSGGVEIESGSLSLTNGAQISANTEGEGDAGLVVIRATDSIFFDGEDSQGFNSGVFSLVQSGAQGNSGGVEIESGSLSLTNGAVINANTLGEGDAGQVVIRATDSIFLDGENSQGFNSGVFSQVNSEAQGNSGGIEIESGSLSLTNGATISANTQGEGNAGLVVIRATDSVFLDGEDTQGGSSRILSGVQSGAKGNSGGVEIESGSLTATNGATINASTLGEGNAGQVVIRATDSIFLDGEDSEGFNSGVFSVVNSGAKGNSGGVEIESGSLTATNGATINASTLGEGNAGLVVIRATDSIFFDGEDSEGFNSGVFSQVESGAQGNSGGIEIESSSLSLTNGALISAETNSSGMAGDVRLNVTDFIQLSGDSAIRANATAGGPAGDLTIETGRITLDNGAEITVSSPSGQAGDLTITADSLRLNQGRILAETATSDAAGGANINLNGLNLLLLENESLISANALEDANGGNVTIDARFIVATPPTGPNGSDITANAVRGNGGAVNVTTQGLFGIEFRPQLTPENDITVSSEFGLSGTYELNSPNVDPSRGLLNLPSQFVDASRQMRQNCPARGSGQENRFVVTGTGGLPPRPGDSIDSPFPTGEVRSLPSSSVSHNAPGKAKVTENVESANRTQIIEATGWVRNDKGEVILVASDPTTPQNGSTSATCAEAVGTR
ncbi:MAG: filamentous hemagglutinin N-terminal domain-containing protein [Coleofasciculus sp. C1-SOL-03]|uniref:two-partner secretion domain-containing protein n=1 Tax=Coleofasciculus sp. C1-SOL-03 TaxID=3069522 RepID=UPI0033043D8B